MTSPTPFMLPSGVSLALGGNNLVVRHRGDVVLEQTLGRRLSRVEAGGDLTIRCEPVHGVLHAEGRLELHGRADVKEIRAREVVLGDVEVRARAIVATERVVIGRSTLRVDVIVAPEVHIDPSATGRIKVIDCHNDIPPTRVRGCLSLEEYEDDHDEAAEFLARRGVVPVRSLVGTPSTAADDDSPPTQDAASDEAEAAPAVMPEPVDEESVEDLPSIAVEPMPDPEPVAEPVGPSPAPMAAAVDEEIDAPTAEDPAVRPGEDAILHDVSFMEKDAGTDATWGDVAVEDAVPAADARPEPEPEPEPEPAEPSRTLSGSEAAKLRREVSRLVGAYPDGLPQAAAELRVRAETGAIDRLADDLDAAWCAVLRDHVRDATQPPRDAIRAFHTLHGLLASP